MPQPLVPKKATLQEVWWDESGKVKETTPEGQRTQAFDVQFNPQTLKVGYSNQAVGGDQPKGSPVQYVGKGTTKLTVELLFDSTVTETGGAGETDVRAQVEKVNAFMRPTKKTVEGKDVFLPPGVRFHWGAFIFEGVMDSMDETIELFSENGVPLRASVSVSMSKQEIQFQRGGAGGAPGTQPLQAAKGGQSFQQMAANAGVKDWKASALANGIENPRQLAAGALVSVSAGVSVGGGGSASLGVSVSGGASVAAQPRADLGVSGTGGLRLP